MEITETGGITNEPKMIIHLDQYEVEKVQSGNPVQLHTGIGDHVHKTVEIQPEARESLHTIEEEIDIIESYCYEPEPMYDDTYHALGTIVDEIDQTNYSIKMGNSVLESYEDFISSIAVQNAIESYWYYQEALEDYR